MYLLEIVHGDFVWAVDDGCKAPLEERLDGISTLTIRLSDKTSRGMRREIHFCKLCFSTRRGQEHRLASHRNCMENKAETAEDGEREDHRGERRRKQRAAGGGILTDARRASAETCREARVMIAAGPMQMPDGDAHQQMNMSSGCDAERGEMKRQARERCGLGT